MDDHAYTERLKTESSGWKKMLDVQAPYRWNLRRLHPGWTLDIGCGIGRNLSHLQANGIGIDVNVSSVDEARKRGFQAMTPDEFKKSEWNRPASFDSLLFSHVLEHLPLEGAKNLMAEYKPFLKPGGQVIIITPQEVGFKSDPTHVTFVDFNLIFHLLKGNGIEVEKFYSFPFPRFAGVWFKYNEFVVLGKNHE